MRNEDYEIVIRKDSITHLEAEMRNQMVPSCNQSKDDKNDVNYQKELVERDAKGQDGEGGCQAQGNSSDDPPPLRKIVSQ